jgi:Domain of unknown function (DUF362)
MSDSKPKTGRRFSRRKILLIAGGAVAATAGAGYLGRRRIAAQLSRLTRSRAFAATPALVPHDPVRERRTLAVARGGTPAGNIDSAIGKLGGIGAVVGVDDVVLVKVSAQWWNQGMTNVAAVKRTLEHILERPGFAGEIVVFENVHFRLRDGSGLARAFTHPSARNVDVPAWTTMGDLSPHFARLGAPVSFVGLVDAARSERAEDHWHDPGHEHGVYGGDGRGPIAHGEDRDGYVWDFDDAFRLRRSWFEHAQTPLSWPVFTSPRSGLVVDLRHGLFRRERGGRVPVARPLTWVNMTTCNEHEATGLTAACKSTMGVVDMSAGRLGLDPRTRDYRSVHYFGAPEASWRMAGPLAHFARRVRSPDLTITVAEWVAATPARGWNRADDIRLAESAAVRANAVVAGTDPVAIDTWCARNLMTPLDGGRRHLYDLDDPDSRLTRFLRYYRQVRGDGTMDPALIQLA